MLEPPALPFGARLINRAASPLSRLLPQLSLAPERLLRQAADQTKLDDFGDDRFREPLRRLTDSLADEADLTPIGCTIARSQIVQGLANRLQIVDWHRRHPEIAAQPIRSPIIIIGMARTGTTILHELLALDSSNRVPMTWEVEEPCPPPETATYHSDPRIERTRQQLDQSERLIPDFKKMHRMGAELPQECVRIMSTEAASIGDLITFRVPRFGNWLLRDYDWQPAFASHQRFLHFLQWRHPGERWVLKTPAYLWTLDAVLQQYPDARFIQTHRDPLRVVASVASLGTTLRAMSSWHPNVADIAREWADWNVEAYDASVELRRSGRLSADNVVDVHFGAFMQDPIAAVGRIYDHFGLQLTQDTETKMRDYLASNQSDKHGRHEYRFSDTGLDAEAERERVRAYQDYFGVAEEPVR